MSWSLNALDVFLSSLIFTGVDVLIHVHKVVVMPAPDSHATRYHMACLRAARKNAFFVMVAYVLAWIICVRYFGLVSSWFAFMAVFLIEVVVVWTSRPRRAR